MNDSQTFDRLLNVLLALITLAALLVALRQLRLQRNAGSRGIRVGAERTGIRKIHNGNVTDSYRAEVHVAGPYVWHEVDVCLEAGGHRFEIPARPKRRTTLSCKSDPIVWDFDLSPEDGARAWFVVSWAEPYGAALRSKAIAVSVGGGPFYRWWWYPGHRWIARISQYASQHGTARMRRRLGSARPLGCWRKYRGAPIRDGNGPHELGRAPDAVPRMFWSCW